jgi:hypothetical protein
MRYRLRTLFVLMGLCCVYAAWVGYVRSRAEHHRRESAAIQGNLASQLEWELREVDTLVTNIASRSRVRIDSLRFGTSGGGVFDRDDEEMAQWRRAANDQILAQTYDDAVLRPWKVLDARFSP